MEEETITITLREYKILLRDSANFNFLQSRGVDNWQGYATAPDREDYDTDEEYSKAYEKAAFSY